MSESHAQMHIEKPVNIFSKPLKADIKALLKALSKGIGHTAVGKWEELGTDSMEAISAIGLNTDPEELAFVFIRRSLTKALFELVGESASTQLAVSAKDADDLINKLDFSMESKDIYIDSKFFDRPTELRLLSDIKSVLQQWLEANGLSMQTSKAIADRLPSYFVFALNQEWRRNIKSYQRLAEVLDTPFAKASDRERAWNTYSALLQRRIQECIFDEPFSLSQLFVPLNAYCLDDQTRKLQTKDIELTPSVWTNMVECQTGSKARNGRKGSCHEETEVVQFRVQASSC